MEAKYLVKVDAGANNNKFYRMIPCGSEFTVEYGRVGNTSFQSMSYPMSLWHKKLDEKLDKGYVDQTRLMVVKVERKDNNYLDINNPSVKNIVNKLLSMARDSIKNNYTISSKQVTQQMVDEAQYLLSNIKVTMSVREFNNSLVELFRIIPRQMRRVVDYLANTESDFRKILQREQDLLDVMRGQVAQEVVIDDDKDVVRENVTILEALGLCLEETKETDVETIKKNLQEMHYRYRNSWVIINNKTQKPFDNFIAKESIQDTKLMWHGSRNENWWSIMNSGLVLRPNAITTGKMFGYGIYFAPSADKSFGYTSYQNSRWAGGDSSTAYMGLFNIAYGKPYDVYSYNGSYGNFGYNDLKQKGAHCLHAHSGNMLRKDEIVVYREEQTTIKYLVELG